MEQLKSHLRAGRRKCQLYSHIHMCFLSSLISLIDGLQSIPRGSNDKDVAAMLEELTIEANEGSFVSVLQHGGNDVT